MIPAAEEASSRSKLQCRAVKYVHAGVARKSWRDSSWIASETRVGQESCPKTVDDDIVCMAVNTELQGRLS